MKKSFEIKNYQIGTDLSVDNTKSKLSDFQISKLQEISKMDNFHSFQSFDFLNERKQNKITVHWFWKSSKNKRSLEIGVNKLLSNIKIENNNENIDNNPDMN